MSKTPKHQPELLALNRAQLDARLNPATPVGKIDPPARGWIYTIRTALGMSQTQLARRLGLSREAVSKWEAREAAGNMTISTLRQAADALGCELLIAFIPREGLQRTAERQAMRKATEERNRIVHTMRLEAQDVGVNHALSQDTIAGDWLTRRSKEIWD